MRKAARKAQSSPIAAITNERMAAAILMPRILTAGEAASYRITAIPSSPATTVVAMSAERMVRRRPSLKEARRQKN